MKKRFCYGCAGDVEIVDGFCLLGHKADEALEPARVHRPSPVSEIRAEVEKVFEEADLQIQQLSKTPVAVGVGAEAEVDLVVAAAAPQPDAPQPGARSSGPDRPVATASQGGERVPPPPPPPPVTRGDMYRDALKHLSDERPTSDPITAFAPPPRVDWGPNKLSLFNLRSLLKQPRA